MLSIEKKILDKLIESGKIDEKLKQRILDEVDRKVGDFETILFRKKIILETDLTKLKSEIIDIPYVTLAGRDIPPETLNVIPLDVAENYKIISFDQDLKTLKVGMVNPYDIRAIEAIDFLAKQQNLKTKIYIISKSDFSDSIKTYHSLGQEIATALEETGPKIKEESGPIELDEEKIKVAPVSKVVSVIIRHGVELEASDIHIEPEENRTKIRYRIDGILHTSLVLPLYMHTPIIARVKVLAKLKLDETRVPQDGRIKIKVENRKIDLRVSVLPLLEREKISMRILDTSKAIPTIEELGFTGRLKEIIERNIKKPFGMILVTGPTGCGKTTTLYTLINKVNSEDINITTLEDPIEYEIPGVNQSQIKPRIKYTFANGLRSILRQDPDIIMVGEIRDNETAEMAIHAGLTGHLLFSTLHTNNALGAVPRLLDMEVEPFLLSSTLNAVIAQRLVRTICEHCKNEIKVPEKLEKQIKDSLVNIDKKDLPKGYDTKKTLKLFAGKGCVHCGNIGYKGRTSIAEIFEVNDIMKEIINEGFPTSKVTKEVLSQKMITMQQNGFIKALKGITTVEEVLRATKKDEHLRVETKKRKDLPF